MPEPITALVVEVADDHWQRLCDVDDRTSPAEYPDMCLITREELGDAIADAVALALKVEDRRKRALDEPPTYARAGGPPDDWYSIRVINLDTGAEVRDVVEVDTVDGWVIQQRQASDVVRKGGHVRLKGRFEIRRPSDA